MNLQNNIKSLLFCVAVGDPLGVTVEFNKMEEISEKPITDMIGFGTYNLPPGTFLDDISSKLIQFNARIIKLF